MTFKSEARRDNQGVLERFTSDSWEKVYTQKTLKTSNLIRHFKSNSVSLKIFQFNYPTKKNLRPKLMIFRESFMIIWKTLSKSRVITMTISPIINDILVKMIYELIENGSRIMTKKV